MTQKEKELLIKILSVLDEYDKKAVNTIIKKLASDEFINYLEVRAALFDDNKGRTKKESSNNLNELSLEKSQVLKRIKRFIKTSKVNVDEIKQAFSQVFVAEVFLKFDNSSIDFLVNDITDNIKNESIDKILEFESTITKLYPQKGDANSLDKWSSLIVKDTPDNIVTNNNEDSH